MGLTGTAGGSRSGRGARAAPPRRGAERRLLLAVAVVVVTLAALAAGGGRAWRWTGLRQNGNLWDWLHLLLVPVALAILPVWLRHYRSNQDRYAAAWRGAGMVLAVAAAVVIAGGYLVPWRWTGFPGNTLWQWLQLLLLPVMIGLLPHLLDQRGMPSGRWLPGAGLGLLAFALLVYAGYTVPWRWTGFTGNTLWDWLELLLVPFALPLTVALVLRGGEQRATAEEGTRHSLAGSDSASNAAAGDTD